MGGNYVVMCTFMIFFPGDLAHRTGAADKNILKIIAGISNINGPGTKYGVKEYHYHENYNHPVDKAHDIAILEIDGAFTFSANIKPIKLPKRGLVIPDDTPLLISGWGYTEHGYPNQLQKAILKRVNHDKCVKIWADDGSVITKDMICATDTNKSICFGDSGGPMVFGRGDNAVLIGVSSFVHSFSCVDPPYTSVFANVIELRDWVINKTNIQEDLY